MTVMMTGWYERGSRSDTGGRGAMRYGAINEKDVRVSKVEALMVIDAGTYRATIRTANCSAVAARGKGKKGSPWRGVDGGTTRRQAPEGMVTEWMEGKTNLGGAKA